MSKKTKITAEQLEMLDMQAYAAEHYDPPDVVEVKISYTQDGKNLEYGSDGKLK